MNADGAKNGMRSAGGTVNVEAAGDDAVNDVLDLLFGCAFLHYDDHGSFSSLRLF
jgi:hypothetical protein